MRRPRLGERAPACVHPRRDHRCGDGEPGRADEHVGGTLDPVDDDPGYRDPLDWTGDEVDIAGPQRGVPVVRDQDAFAAGAVVRRCAAVELAVAQRQAPQQPEPESADRADHAVREHRPPQLVRAEREPTREPLQCRKAPERGTAQAGGTTVEPGHDPRRAALKHVDVRGDLAHLGHELDRGRSRSDDGDPRAGRDRRRDPNAPSGTARRRRSRARRWRARSGRRTGRTRRRRRAPRGVRRPPRLSRHIRSLFVPLGTLELGAETDLRRDPEPVGDTAQVGEDLALRRKDARPVRVGRERERVQVRSGCRTLRRGTCCRARCRRPGRRAR